ncbi:hypothetical protein RRG08_040353 [Elysia crispata]|uniref:Uncharacterized protein n=1 Tax=Elysia crispata TaxID=231223 RepID=A0AAE1D4S2_9GAST|nr:hypothetical protein RRG08_040353 [Elysia crispata]
MRTCVHHFGAWMLAGKFCRGSCEKHNLLRGTGDLGTSSMWCRWAGYPESVYMAEVKEVSDVSITRVMQTQDKTGAEHLHVARDDGNNCTQCYVLHNTDGEQWVPHILEHIILCGFEKFPVQDPFFKMLSFTQY